MIDTSMEWKLRAHGQILLTIMTGAIGFAGWFFGRKPTSSSSETPVSIAPASMPWQTESKGDGADQHFKYQYHPGGDETKKPKDAPSALNSVIVPNVTLPKVSASTDGEEAESLTPNAGSARPFQQIRQGRLLDARRSRRCVTVVLVLEGSRQYLYIRTDRIKWALVQSTYDYTMIAPFEAQPCLSLIYVAMFF